jgi:hypothetical protein
MFPSKPRHRLLMGLDQEQQQAVRFALLADDRSVADIARMLQTDWGCLRTTNRPALVKALTRLRADLKGLGQCGSQPRDPVTVQKFNALDAATKLAREQQAAVARLVELSGGRYTAQLERARAVLFRMLEGLTTLQIETGLLPRAGRIHDGLLVMVPDAGVADPTIVSFRVTPDATDAGRELARIYEPPAPQPPPQPPPEPPIRPTGGHALRVVRP